MVEIVKVTTKKQQKEFVEFPLRLYKNNKYFVPPIYMDEMSIFSKDYVYSKTCDSIFFLAINNGKTVGRIQGIIQRQFNEIHGEKRLRFTRFDCIDDIEVAKKLFSALEEYGREMGMDTLCGPLGYSDLEREGLLIEGFEELATFGEQYNYSYYQKLVESVGLEKEVDWLEFKVKYPKEQSEKVKRVSERALELNKLHVANPKLSKSKLLKRYADGIFKCLDVCYKELYGTVPFTEDMKKQILSQFKLFIEKKWMLIILDEKDNVVAFGFCMPQLGKALQKSGGRLTLCTLLKLLKALKKPKVLEFCLIGVVPEYQSKGVNSIALDGIMNMLKKDIEYCETNLCLETNHKILAQWNYFDAQNHKKRRAYCKKI
ncbi:MAG: hypothetical protein J6Q38_01405 [Clostridia bacterium]|nr:hypothetical protein [Clostridia bacterium]